MHPLPHSAPRSLRGLRGPVLRAALLALALRGVAFCEPVAPAPLPPVAKAVAENLVHTFLKCWESGDLATFSGLLDDGVVFAYPGGRFNKAELVQTFKDYHVQKKDIKIYFSDFFLSDGYRHVTSYQFAATDQTTGARFAVGTGVICKIRDGKFVEFKEYWDSEVPGRQKLGELPLDEGQKIAPWPSSVLLRAEKIN
jgi:ketosteroid isomerase-like protein